MKVKKWERESGISIICVDRYEEEIPEGRIYNQQYPGGVYFRGVMDFLKTMEHIMELSCQITAGVVRTFASSPAADVRVPESSRSHEGACATFTVRILFLQNASWQGSISWLEGYKEESFRSVLELLLLMDSALHTEKK